MRTLLTGALLLALAAPASAGNLTPEQTRELQEAREEVQRAREELRRAAAELARVAREVDHDSPRAQAYDYMTNPKRAMLGVTIESGPEKNGSLRGVLVTGVTPGGGAAKAGLKSGDILLSANGKSLSAKAGAEKEPELLLRDIMRELQPGDEVKLEYEREGKAATVTVVATRPMEAFPYYAWKEGDFDVVVPPVPELPDLPPMPPMAMMRMLGGPDLGMQLAKLDADLAPYFKTDKGVLVVKAPREGSLGLKGGDVIVEIDDKAVSSPVEAWEKFAGLEGEDKVKVEVLRQGKVTKLEGTLPERKRIIRREIERERSEERHEHKAP